MTRNGRFLKWVQPRTLVVAGIGLRLVTFLFLHPLNADYAHYDNIRYIVQNHRLPLSGVTSQSYHPPLYYLLASPIEALTGSAKAVQALSLLFSIATLLLLYRLIYRKDILQGERARLYALAFACFLPQFVMFGLYVSNDTLAIVLGALLILQATRFLERVGWTQALLLGVVLGLGLLTKTTFLAFLPVVVLFVGFAGWRQHHRVSHAVLQGAVVLLLASVVGGYKIVENITHSQPAFVTNIDQFPSFKRQQQTYRGAWSFLDFNLYRLLASPTASEATLGSYPLLLYGTFWYQHDPVSNFMGGAHPPFLYLGSMIYVAGLLPTAVFLIGMAELARRSRVLLAGPNRYASGDDARRLLIAYLSCALLLSNLALLIAAVAKYHVWSIMQGRLLFPAMFGFLAGFAVGAQALDRWWLGRLTLRWAMCALTILWALYFFSEFAYQILLRYFPGSKPFIKLLIG